jgi:Conserved hypothetical protein 698
MAGLIYWAVIYYAARKWFGFSREWAAPLASGISICGVSAAIATGGAIRSRPGIPVLVSSLVVVFAVIEVLILPLLAQTFLSNEPLVAAAWIGLAVKTDGAAVAAGGITEALLLAKSAAQGVHYQPGWLLGTTATIKVFIDVFIGIWAFILAYIWTNHINPREGDKATVSEIWQRFPKFILGFVATFLVGLALALWSSPETLAKLTPAVAEANTFPGHLLYPDVFLDWRSLKFPQALGGRPRQTRRRLFLEPIRLCHLGWIVDRCARKKSSLRDRLSPMSCSRPRRRCLKTHVGVGRHTREQPLASCRPTA